MAPKSHETGRNVFHVIAGLAVAFLFYLGIIDVWALLAVTLCGFALSVARRRKKVPVIDWFLRRFEREDVMGKFPGRGAFYLFLGMLLSAALFPRDVACASMAILALGDGVSPIVGMHKGRIRHPLSPGRMLEGSVAGFIAAALGAMLFVPLPEALLASFIAMAVEAVDTVKGRRLEDNITMPLVSGIVMLALRALS